MVASDRTALAALGRWCQRVKPSEVGALPCYRRNQNAVNMTGSDGSRTPQRRAEEECHDRSAGPSRSWPCSSPCRTRPRPSSAACPGMPGSPGAPGSAFCEPQAGRRRSASELMAIQQDVQKHAPPSRLPASARRPRRWPASCFASFLAAETRMIKAVDAATARNAAFRPMCRSR